MAKARNAQWKKSNAPSRDEQFALKRHAVLETAARAFADNGYYQTSLDDIASELNITKPTLYYYIKNKEDILFECKQIGLVRMGDAMAEAERLGKNGLERIMIFLGAYGEYVLNDFFRCLVFLDNRALNAKTRAKLQEGERALDKRLRTWLIEGMEDGSVASVNPKMATFMLFGAFNWIPHWYQKSGEFAPPEIAKLFLGYLRDGIASRDDAADKS